MVSDQEKKMLQKLRVLPNELNWNILTSCFNYHQSHDLQETPIFKSPRLLNDSDLRYVENYSKEAKFSPEELPFKIEEGLGEPTRKKYAAYYTAPPAANAFGIAIDKAFEGDIVLADPFCGGGALLSPIVKKLGDKIRYAYGFEIFPFAAMGAYISMVGALAGDAHRVKMVVGDSFATIHHHFFGGGLFGDVWPRPNAVVSNPPFLPWSKVPENAKRVAMGTLRSGGYDEEEGNFTSFGAALGDIMLEKGGFYGIVLPQSIFYNDKTRAALNMFYDRYDLRAMLTRDVFCKPYSLYSSAMDVLMMGFKGGKPSKYYAAMVPDATLEKIVSQFDTMGTIDGFAPRTLATTSPMGMKNPGSYIMEPELSAVLEGLYKKWGPKMGSLEEVFGKNPLLHQASFNITPLEFFFVPNSKWSMAREKPGLVTLRDVETGLKIEIEEQKTEPVFLKPIFSKGSSVAAPTHLALKFNERLTDAEEVYVESWGIKKSGYWWTHYRDMMLKEPLVNVHLARVLNLAIKYYAGIAYYTEEPLAPVSAFIRFASWDRQKDRVAVSWFNSMPFVATLMTFGRRLNQDSLYMTSGDYASFPFPRIDTMTGDELEKFSRHLDGLTDVKSFWESIPRPHDADWMEWLGSKGEDMERLVKALKASRGRWKPGVL